MNKFMMLLGKLLFFFKKRKYLDIPQTIVIIKIGAIGDVLMSTPLVRNIKKRFPNSRLIYVVGKWSQEVLRGNPYINQIISFDDDIIWERKYLKIFYLIRSIRKFHGDLGFILDRHFFAGLFGFFCGIKFRIGFDRNGEGFSNNQNIFYGPVRHEIEYNLDLLRIFRSKPDSCSMEVFLSSDDKLFADAFIASRGIQKPILGIMAGGAQNPGQTMFIRRWPLSHYVSLIKKLTEYGNRWQIMLFGGPSDKEVNEKIIEQTNSKVINIAGQTTIKQSMALMKKCNLFVTHDSGPMHMAAAVGTPVISIFGPVHPARKAPRGQQHRYIWKPDLEGALCDNEGKFPGHLTSLPCMEEILPAEIFNLITSYEKTRSTHP